MNFLCFFIVLFIYLLEVESVPQLYPVYDMDHIVVGLYTKMKNKGDLIIEDKLKSESSSTASTVPASNVSATNFTQSLENSTNNCFSTNQVLFIIAVTCFLNFAFIVLIMACVQILGSTANEREISDESALLNDDREELGYEGGLNNWKSAKLRVASLPDNIFSEMIAERLLQNQIRKQRIDDSDQTDEQLYPTSHTYHFRPAKSLDNEDTDSDDTDSGKCSYHGLQHPWDGCETEYKIVNFDPRKYEMFYAQNNT